jgi:hypothetical protein
MENLSWKVRGYLKANGKTWDAEENNIILQNDGSGNFVHTWNVSGLEKPTDEQLDALDATAITAISNHQVDKTRKRAYGSWNDQLDEIYHDIDAWKARIQAIKDANAKE